MIRRLLCRVVANVFPFEQHGTSNHDTTAINSTIYICICTILAHNTTYASPVIVARYNELAGLICKMIRHNKVSLKQLHLCKMKTGNIGNVIAYWLHV